MNLQPFDVRDKNCSPGENTKNLGLGKQTRNAGQPAWQQQRTRVVKRHA